MTISDLILQLAKQTKQLEKTASALHTKDDAELKARGTELRNSLAKVKSTVDAKLDTNSKIVADRVAGLQRTLSDGFQAVRADESARGKVDAEDAIAVALHALQEAEYLLTAAAARDDADNATTKVAAKKAVAATDHDSSNGTKAKAKSHNQPTK